MVDLFQMSSVYLHITCLKIHVWWNLHRTKTLCLQRLMTMMIWTIYTEPRFLSLLFENVKPLPYMWTHHVSTVYKTYQERWCPSVPNVQSTCNRPLIGVPDFVFTCHACSSNKDWVGDCGHVTCRCCSTCSECSTFFTKLSKLSIQ